MINEAIANLNSATQDGHNNTYFGSCQSTISKGRESADLFLLFTERQGYKVVKSDSYTDRIKHIDYILYKGEEKFCSVDIKSRSRYGWSGEIVNNYGYPGSMYSEADFLVYVDIYKKLAYFVPPIKLQELYKSKNFKGEKQEMSYIINHSDDITWNYTHTFGRIKAGSQDQVFFFTQTDLERMAVVVMPLF